jgi:hypothetical protein
MKIEFIVGKLEQHEVVLSFDHHKGDLRILMDGAPVLQDSPRLTHNSIKHYEINVGNSEKHRLALQLAYADQPGIGEEPGTAVQAAPRLSLAVTAIAPQSVVPESLGLNAADSVFAARTAAQA